MVQSTTLQVIDQPDVRLIVYTPLLEGDTAQKLLVLAGFATTGTGLPLASKANLLQR